MLKFSDCLREGMKWVEQAQGQLWFRGKYHVDKQTNVRKYVGCAVGAAFYGAYMLDRPLFHEVWRRANPYVERFPREPDDSWFADRQVIWGTIWGKYTRMTDTIMCYNDADNRDFRTFEELVEIAEDLERRIDAESSRDLKTHLDFQNAGLHKVVLLPVPPMTVNTAKPGLAPAHV